MLAAELLSAGIRGDSGGVEDAGWCSIFNRRSWCVSVSEKLPIDPSNIATIETLAAFAQKPPCRLAERQNSPDLPNTNANHTNHAKKGRTGVKAAFH